jgi:hypothetical protein
VRDYPVTEDELDNLFKAGMFAAFLFFLGTSALGFSISLFKDLSLAADAPKDAVVFWSTVRWVLAVFGLCAYAYGAFEFYRSRNHISRIKAQTTFQE